jgi:putative peptide zinc metalloprotease protein
MAVTRPTFSETWYRVAELKPKLRSTVQTYRQHFRGKTYHVIQDPTSNQYFRLDDAGYYFTGLLDGRRSIAQVWEHCNEQLGDRAPTQGETIQLLSQLYSSNLLSPDLPPDATTLFDRRRKRIQREVRSYLSNLLFARIPLWDPDRFLERWVPVAGLMFTWPAFVLWCVLMFLTFNSLTGRWSDLFDQSNGVISPANLPLLYICFAIIKFIHEMGHGFSCKKFGLTDHSGGEVHVLGIMLLVLVPVPYVDASSSWALRSKWKRALVGAAGMYVELAVAAIAALVWANSAQNTLTHQVAYNLMFIASVSTILFNANPLLRFDGYYIMSDVFELPNLYQRSKDYVYYLIKKYLYGVRNPTNPSRSSDEKPWLVVYAIAAFIYRIIISISILMFIAGQLFFIGLLMAIAGIVGWVIVPLGKWMHYLSVGPELWRTRRRAVLWTVGTIGGVIAVLGAVPMPDRSRAEGIVEPRHVAVMHAETDGFVRDVLVSGLQVTAGHEALVVADNFELQRLRDELTAAVAEVRVQYRQAVRENPALAQSLSQRMAALQEQLDRTNEQLADLTMTSPIDGRWISFDHEKYGGIYLQRGQAVGVVASLDDLIVRAIADQYLGPRVESDIGIGGEVEFRVRGQPDLRVRGRIERIPPAGAAQLPSAALGYMAGGALAVDPSDASGTKTSERFFEVVIRPIDAREGILLPGQRVVIRFTMNRRSPMLAQWYREVRQVIQRRFSV